MPKTAHALLKGKSIAVATHYYGTGPGEALREFLPDRAANFFWLGYPLYQGKPVILESKIARKRSLRETRWRSMPELIRYGTEVKHTIRTIIKSGVTYDLYIGIDSLNALAGIIAKKLGRVKKVAFYTIDFVPERFSNPLLNTLYHRIDRFCVEHADITWNLSDRMAEGREKVSGYPQRLREKQLELPIGVWWSRIKPKKTTGNRAIFVGHITEKQGVQLVIEAIPKIIKVIPDFYLDVAGDGPYRSTLEEQVQRLGLSKYVTFHGFIKKDQDVEKMVARSALTLALYRKENDPFTYYADPGKLKVYLASGVPVLLTDLPAIARKIERAKAGLIVEYDHRSVARAIIKMLKNPKELKSYRANARAFAKQFDWPTIFGKAFKSVI
ncbi:glycosyltransferase [Candidatus Berkelbacteria bacterium]|nr:glycosyltransferase [Candidatus Berkelbacteria bacterium]